MVTFTYKLKSCMGIHARTASDLAEIARKYSSSIKIYSKNRCANVRRIVDLMELNALRKEILLFEINGTDENEALLELQAYCKKNL